MFDTADPGAPSPASTRPRLTPRGRIVLAAALVTSAALLVRGVLASEDPALSAQIPVASTPIPVAPASPSTVTADPAQPTASTTQPAPEGTQPSGAPEPTASPGVRLMSNVDGLPPTVVAPGDAPVTGPQQGVLYTYTVETVESLAEQLPALQAAVEESLGNTTQGWSARTGDSFQRIERPEEASIRVVLAPPAVVDDMCWRVGLDTAGLYSCWDGYHTMLNSDRWFTATVDFADLQTYRTYLINHEVGHGIGMGHEFCAGPGELAPLMQQQSISLQGCRPNAWPNPT